MSDIDPNAHAERLAAMASDKEKGLFRSNLTATADSAAARGLPQGTEVLAWLAGNRLRTGDKDDLRPRSPGSRDAADALIPDELPEDPIIAAGKRSSVLADLRRDAPKDPRVIAIFEADPIVAEDPSTATVITSRMLRARADLFDEVLTLMGRPLLTPSARSWMAVHLSNVFTLLSRPAQKEWALSEMRLQETRKFLGKRPKSELDALSTQINSLMDSRSLWEAARALSIAACIGVSDSTKSAQIADLLELRDLDAD